MDFKLYQQGYAFDAYRHFGAHPCENGTVFRTHAPNAENVSLIGEFSNWEELPMQAENGVWSLYVEGALPGMMYKYRITGADGFTIDHADPYAFLSEMRPNTASIIYDHSRYVFNDDEWVRRRDRCFNKPVSIYEIHVGSWRTKVHELGETYNGQKIDTVEDNWFSYRELARPLAEYLTKMGFTHVELMPLMEHPLDNSWGYQPTGFFAPTSRYGTPDDLKYLIDTLHSYHIGVIMDFVPVHFAVDGYGLSRYDGTPFYEYPHPDVGYSEWGSNNFMHSKGEVSSFLMSAAAYWIDKFHIDGLRFDAVSRLIYWHGDPNRGFIDHSIQFLKGLNAGLHKFFPGVMLIAEDSTDYPMVTTPTKDGGLEFDYKWDMGWMNDTLDFFRTAPWIRMHSYNKISFSMMYFYNENFILPFSHDEVVHGKATIAQKMWGPYDEKFPQLRSLYLYMFAHPGKKLNFMGNEIGQLREWDEKREQDWNLKSYPMHDSFSRFFADLNHLYRAWPQLYEGDYDPASYEWVIVDDGLGVVYAFRRGLGREKIFFIFNFSGQDHTYYTFYLRDAEILQELINTDWEEYSGKTRRLPSDHATWSALDDGRVAMHLPPYGSRAFLIRMREEENRLRESDKVQPKEEQKG